MPIDASIVNPYDQDILQRLYAGRDNAIDQSILWERDNCDNMAQDWRERAGYYQTAINAILLKYGYSLKDISKL